MTPKTPYFSMRFDVWIGSTKALQGRIAIEYAFLNIGIVAFMAFGFANMHRGALYGAVIVFVGIAMHVYNMAAMLIRRRKQQSEMASQP